MNKQKFLAAVSTSVLIIGLISNAPAESVTNSNREIQILNKKIGTLEKSIQNLKRTLETIKVSTNQDSKSISDLKNMQILKLSFVALIGRDLKCPMGSVPADKLDGIKVESGFPDGFSFKNTRAFGVLSGAQINLGVCEINVYAKP